MKYNHKCPVCNREATTKYGRVMFCNTHAKEARSKKARYVSASMHVGDIPSQYGNLAIYKDYWIRVR